MIKSLTPHPWTHLFRLQDHQHLGSYRIHQVFGIPQIRRTFPTNSMTDKSWRPNVTSVTMSTDLTLPCYCLVLNGVELQGKRTRNSNSMQRKCIPHYFKPHQISDSCGRQPDRVNPQLIHNNVETKRLNWRPVWGSSAVVLLVFMAPSPSSP